MATVLIAALATGQNVTAPAHSDLEGILHNEGTGNEQAKKVTKAEFDRLKSELSNWGRWGVKDELGAVHLITQAKRMEAAALVKMGLPVSLAHDDSTEESADNNLPIGHKMLSTDSSVESS